MVHHTGGGNLQAGTNQSSLIARIANLEDGLTERKQGLHSNEDIRKATVSFVNSVPEGRTAVLYIGVSNDGTIVGVSTEDAEKFQIRVRRICEDECFPPIAIQLAEVLNVQGKNVVAFEFGPSQNRPHFTGHAYMRVGSESVKVSASKLDELIASRNTKAGRLITAKDKHELLALILPARSRIPGQLPLARQRNLQCKVENCDAHTAKFYDIADQQYIDLPLEFLVFGVDRNLNRLLVEYTRI
jgi:Putative DNA-binding domain